MNIRNILSIFILPALIIVLSSGCNLVSSSTPPQTPTKAISSQAISTQDLPQQTPSTTAEVEITEATPVNTLETPATLPASVTPEISATPPFTAGLRIFFLQDNDIWYWSEDAVVDGGQQLTHYADVARLSVSDDGQVLAFTRGDPYASTQIWAMQADGTDERQLVSPEELSALDAANTTVLRTFWFLPVSHILAYTTTIQIEGLGVPVHNDLSTVDADSLGKITVFKPDQGALDYYYSPDWSKILLVDAESIAVSNIDGSNLRVLLTYPVIYTYSEWMFRPKPVWSSDSSFVRVAVPPQDPLGNPSAKTILWHIPMDGSAATQLADFVATPAFFSVPTFSPDGSKIAYLTGEAEKYQLHIANFDLSGDAVITTGDIFISGWAPDSQHILIYERSLQTLQVWAPGGKEALVSLPLKSSASILAQIWVDTSRFIYLTGDYQNPELWLGNIDGSSIQVASANPSHGIYDYAPKR